MCRSRSTGTSSSSTPRIPNVQIAFVHRDNDAVPAPLKHAPQGFFVTIETRDVDELYEKARKAGHEIMVELTDEEWGQRRFVTVDPNGLPVDVFRLDQAEREVRRRARASLARSRGEPTPMADRRLRFRMGRSMSGNM